MSESNTHKYYQPKSITVQTRQLGKRHWGWRVCGYFYEEVAHGIGCKTKAEARRRATAAKLEYLKTVTIAKINIELKNGKR